MTEAKEKLAGKFASENHAGPKDVVDFLDLDDEESTEELREMCQHCEAYAGIKHDYTECKGKMCFNFYLAFVDLEWRNAFKGERW